jgi:MFS family permease
LSQANGFINALTNVAVILGSLAAGPLADLYYPTAKQAVAATAALEVADGENATVVAATTATPQDDYVLIPDPSRQPQRLPVGITLVLVSVAGLLAITAMPKMQPVDPNVTLSFDFLRGHMQTLKDASRPVMVVLMSWSGFYFIGALALLLIPEYRAVLGVSNSSITSLTGMLAISIVIGSCAVGWLSGRSIRPYYALLGAAGMTVCFAIMGIAPMTYERLAILMSLVGISAGFYIVPLQSLLQYLSPPAERGRFFGTANALSFAFIAASGVLFFVLRQSGVPTERMPLVCAGLALFGTIVGMVELKRLMGTNENGSIT